MTPTTQRRILLMVSRNGPMTAKAIAAGLDIDERNAANLCSLMAGSGLLDEHPNERGGRHGRRYGTTKTAHPRDKKTIEDLVKDYGATAVRAMVRDAAGAPS